MYFQMNADGEVDWEVARAKISPSVSQEQTDVIYNACKDISKYEFDKNQDRFLSVYRTDIVIL